MAENANAKPEDFKPPVTGGEQAATNGQPPKAGTDATATTTPAGQPVTADLSSQTWSDAAGFRSLLTPNAANGTYDLSDLRIDVNKALWSDAAFRKEVKAGVDQVVARAYGNDKATIDNTELTALQKEREAALAHHKPGEQWIENGVRCKLSEKGALIKMDAKGDDIYVSPDGSAYVEKHDPKDVKNYTETWFKPNGQAIRHIAEHDASGKLKSTYEYFKGKGRWDEISDQVAVQHFGSCVVDLKDHLKSRLTLEFIEKAPEGLGNMADGVLATLYDQQENKLFKLTTQPGVFLYDHTSKKIFHVFDGKVREFDLVKLSPSGPELEEMHGLFRRDTNGDILFGTTSRVSKTNELTDSAKHLDFKDGDRSVTATLDGHRVTVSVHNGLIKSEEADGSVTTNNTLTHHIESRDLANKILYSSDLSLAHGLTFKTPEIDFDGRTTHIHNAYMDLTITNMENGTTQIADGKDTWTSGSDWQLQIAQATSFSEMALQQAASVGLAVCSKFSGNDRLDASDLAALDAVIGQLGAAQAACLRCGADQVAVSLSLVSGRLEGIKGEAAVRLSVSTQLSSNGANSMQVGQALSRLGSGMTPHQIVVDTIRHSTPT
jgi:hypothetical protein